MILNSSLNLATLNIFRLQEQTDLKLGAEAPTIPQMMRAAPSRYVPYFLCFK